jgi:hypothetical protein
VNKLNAIRHQRKNKQKKLEQLQKNVESMSKETEEIQKTDIGESPDAQVRAGDHLEKGFRSHRRIPMQSNPPP